MRRDAREAVASAFAAGLLAGRWHPRSLHARGGAALGVTGAWLRRIVSSVMQRWPQAPLSEHRALTRFIVGHEAFREAWTKRLIPRAAARRFLFHPEMRPARWPVPVLHTVGDVASWLEVDDGELRWFADTGAAERLRSKEVARHYTREWLPRGAKLPRLLEAPKSRLKSLQRRVLHELLEKLPVHDAAHGFVAGRSVLTHARLHVGRAVVVRFDLRHFFTSVSTGRAFGVLRELGYTHEVSAVLLGLCTTRTPSPVLRASPIPDDADGAVLNDRFFMLRALDAWHLPQGAPTSPAWANLCSWWLDARLASYAKSVGLTYSRYADDLVFSGDAQTSVLRLSSAVDTVARDEGFRVNVGKTRVMRAGQRQEVTGVVVNAKPNVRRVDFDALKALLNRCETRGALSQSKGPLDEFRAELMGRVAWVAQLNAARGEKLKRQLARIVW